jgi:hypothetical protein
MRTQFGRKADPMPEAPLSRNLPAASPFAEPLRHPSWHSRAWTAAGIAAFVRL